MGLSLNVIDYIYFRGFILAKLAMTDIDAKINWKSGSASQTASQGANAVN